LDSFWYLLVSPYAAHLLVDLQETAKTAIRTTIETNIIIFFIILRYNA